MAQPDGLEALDGLAAQVNNDLQSLKDFNLASNHLFEEKAYFYYRQVSYYFYASDPTRAWCMILQ